MSSKDLHKTAFDEGSTIKLDIFKAYAKAWVPTFLMQNSVREIHIFDFFAGPGYDAKGQAGSPIILLEIIKDYIPLIMSSKTKIIIHFNEFEPNRVAQKKFESLKRNCCQFINEEEKFKYYISVRYYNEDSKDLFYKLEGHMNNYPSLVYLDQNGVKFLARDFLETLSNIKTIDFLYFVSSSYFRRFSGTPEFQAILDLNEDEIERKPFQDIHRLVLEKVKERMGNDSKVHLFPFSIMKQSNIYGIIFGSKNWRAVDKFLQIAWSQNDINGEANFDIDKDQEKGQIDLFGGKKLTKIEAFQERISNKVLAGEIRNNEGALFYTYSEGHIPKHASDALKKLKKLGKIHYESRSPYITYNNVVKAKKLLNYKLV